MFSHSGANERLQRRLVDRAFADVLEVLWQLRSLQTE
jgi:hypothetical protein